MAELESEDIEMLKGNVQNGRNVILLHFQLVLNRNIVDVNSFDI